MPNTLIVLWRLSVRPIPSGAVVVSFLLPADEQTLNGRLDLTLIRGRERRATVSAEALRLYRELVARIGVTPVNGCQTLRQMMARPGHASRWWYHDLAVRDSESRWLYSEITQTLIVRAVAQEFCPTAILLVGAPPGVTAMFKGAPWRIEREGGRTSRWHGPVLSLGSRSLFLLRQLRYRLAVGRPRQARIPQLDVAFSNFWDWGLRPDKKNATFVDRYFKGLPHLLRTKYGIGCGYFAWFDPHFEPDQRGRRLRDVLQPVRTRPDIILLQQFLRWRDIFRVALDFRPWRAARTAARRIERDGLLKDAGIDWAPLFIPALLRGCLGAQIPHFELVSIATERAAAAHRPRVTLSFLEHFPYARAHYDGVHRGSRSTTNWAMQHAGVCHEKTFYYLHPIIEFAGKPDDCPVPTPNRVFAMGSLGHQIFLECGYKPDQVVLSGSARYDHICLPAPDRIDAPSDVSRSSICVLLACTLEVETEIGLIEAVVLAAKGLSGITLRVRNHPTCRVDEHPRFKACSASVEISAASLHEDLAWCNLVVFSYSTVADEAYLLGKPTWQWLPLRFNGSALAEVVEIPTFGAVSRLREELIRFCTDSSPYIPNLAQRQRAALCLFGPADGCAADRIASACVETLASGEKSDRGFREHTSFST